MEVILRPLRKDQWAGVFKYKNCNDYLGSYFTRAGNIYTGLTPEQTERLGKILNKDLRSSSDFWSTFVIKIGNKDIIIDTEKGGPEDRAMEELKYYFLKSHKRVANGIGDPNPTANYILVDKESEAKDSNKHNQTKRKAMKEFDKLSVADMRKVLRLYGHKSDTLSQELVENKLFDLIEENPSKFFDKWIENKHKETEFSIQEAVAKNIIVRNKSEYKYGSDVIGHSLEDTIAYLEAPDHRDLKAIIINETNTK